MKCLINERKLIIALICGIAFAVLTALLVSWKAWLAATISLILCVIYCVTAVLNGGVVRIDGERVSCRFLFKEVSMKWEEIEEVGVIGLRVLNSEGKKHKGSKNIYFSKTKMSDDERFQMCVDWPPKDKIYFRFSYKRIAAVQKLWARHVNMYNVGNLRF